MSEIVSSVVSLLSETNLSPMLLNSLSPQKPHLFLDPTRDVAYFEHFTYWEEPAAYYTKYVSSSNSANSEIFNQEDYHINVVVGSVNKTLAPQLNPNYTIHDHFKSFGDIPFYMKSNSSDNLDIMFPGVRLLEDNLIVFEMPPAMRHVSYQEAFRDNASGDTYREYYLPIPWQIYFATFSDDMRLVSVQMYFSQTSLFSTDQKLYSAPIFNFYSDGTLCRPFFESMDDIEKYPKTHSGVMASAFDWIWNSGFNWDITENINTFLVTRKYQQMKDYVDIKNDSAFAYLDACKFYASHPSSVDHVSTFFSIWQSIPLQDIINIEWNSFCIHEDFFRHSFSSYVDNEFSDIFQKYLEENDIQITDEEYIDEDTDPDSITTYENIMQSSHFHKYIYPLMASYNSTFQHAYNKAAKVVFSFKKNNSSFAGQHRSVQAAQQFKKILSNFVLS